MGVVEDDIVEARRDKATMVLRSIDFNSIKSTYREKTLRERRAAKPVFGHRSEGRIPSASNL